MIRVHHLRIGRSVFTLWLLEELGLDYQLEIYERGADFRAPERLKAAHPLGKSPVIELDGVLLAESGAIAVTLIDRFDTQHRLSPPRDDWMARARWTQWLHYPEGSAFLPLMLTLLLSREAEPKPPLISGFTAKEVALHLDYLSTSLGDQPYILGEHFQAPDIALSYILTMAEQLGRLRDHPALNAYVARTTAREAFKRAWDKGGG